MKRENIYLNIFMNNFFCFSLGYNCIDKLIVFFNKYECFCLKLIVVNLYNICRKFCKDFDEDYIKFKRFDIIYIVNYIGLRNFM